jgi:hypothetical protein
MSPTAKSTKGGRKGWATADQDAFLKEQIPSYLTARADGQRGLNPFWNKLYESWFTRWPDPSTLQSEPADASSRDLVAADEASQVAESKKLV